MVAYQPTIPIKNANGTVEYITLEEFEKRKQEMTSKSKEKRRKKPVVSGQKIQDKKREMEKDTARESRQSFANDDVKSKNKKEIKKNLLKIESPHELAMTTPVTEIFVDEAEAKLVWNKDDHKSLLEEESPKLAKKYQHKKVVAFKNKKDFKSIKGVSLSDDLLSRLNSLVVSYQKGVRNKHQFLSYATQTVSGGGLGLSKQVANSLLGEISTSSESDQKKILKKKRRALLAQSVQKKTFIKPVLSVKDIEEKKPVVLKQKINDQKSLAPKPVLNEIKTDFIAPVKKEKQKILPVAPLIAVAPTIKQSTQKASDKSLIHDVTSAVSEEQTYRTVGPEEEIGNFTLTDFRRLSADSQKAGELLLYKFHGWKEESYLLYLKIVRAWQKSPLYLSYVSISRSALESQKTVKDLLPHEPTGDQMTEEEYRVLIKVNKDL